MKQTDGQTFCGMARIQLLPAVLSAAGTAQLMCFVTDCTVTRLRCGESKTVALLCRQFNVCANNNIDTCNV